MHTDRSCARWEAAIADLLDGEGMLAPEEKTRLREHAAGCESCGALLDEAERGRDWARLLHDAPPIPPAALLGRILAQAPGGREFAADPLSLGGALVLPHPAAVRGQHQARALMTVAMAFFSLALTWSVSGARLYELQPSHVKAAAARQFFGAKKEVVGLYDNLRVLREIELAVETLRRNALPERTDS